MRLFFALAVVFFYLYGLSVPFVGPDEPRYAQVAREMFERGDFVTPTLGGFLWFEKPALLYWLEIASFHVFGVSEFAARFFPALFGLGIILALWIIGSRTGETISGTESADSLNSALSGRVALFASATLGIIVFARGASFDIVLTFPMTAALVGFFVYDRAAESGGRYVGLAAFYFFVGLSLLAKGLVGAIFPFAIIGSYFLLSMRLPRRDFLISLIWGGILSAAVASPWYVPMYLRHGWRFIDEFFIQHHFQRYTSNKFQHPQPFHFFLWVLPLMTIPWLPFFLGGVWSFLKNFITGMSRPGTEDASAVSDGESAQFRGGKPAPLLVFAFAWMAVPLVFFSFSGSKLPGYILPAVPAAIIISAVYSMRFTANRPRRKTLIHFTAAATFLIVLALIHFALPRFAADDSVKGLIAAADSRGYAESNVAGFLTVSHNAEFYAAGRLLRMDDGKQRRFIDPSEIVDEIRSDGGRALLVLVPREHLRHILQSNLLASEVLGENAELAIVAVSLK